MPLNVMFFAPLLVLCLCLSIREWLRYRAGKSTQFVFVAQIVCFFLCLFALITMLDENMRTDYAKQAVDECIAHLRAGNMPELDPAIHFVEKDMIAEYKGRPFPEQYTVKFLGGVKEFAVAEAQFANGERMSLNLHDVRKGPRYWPPFFATPEFRASLIILISNDEAPKPTAK
jgi:hypothetical protein